MYNYIHNMYSIKDTKGYIICEHIPNLIRLHNDANLIKNTSICNITVPNKYPNAEIKWYISCKNFNIIKNILVGNRCIKFINMYILNLLYQNNIKYNTMELILPPIQVFHNLPSIQFRIEYLKITDILQCLGLDINTSNIIYQYVNNDIIVDISLYSSIHNVNSSINNKPRYQNLSFDIKKDTIYKNININSLNGLVRRIVMSFKYKEDSIKLQDILIKGSIIFCDQIINFDNISSKILDKNI